MIYLVDAVIVDTAVVVPVCGVTVWVFVKIVVVVMSLLQEQAG